MERIADGDVTALAELYDQCGATGYALAFSCCGNGDRAERIVREVFLDLWTDPGGVPRPDPVAVEVLRRVRSRATGPKPDTG